MIAHEDVDNTFKAYDAVKAYEAELALDEFNAYEAELALAAYVAKEADNIDPLVEANSTTD